VFLVVVCVRREAGGGSEEGFCVFCMYEFVLLDMFVHGSICRCVCVDGGGGEVVVV
jgi:hypothetical protein